MGPIELALMRIKKTIPADVLKQCFSSKRYDPTRKDRYFDNVSATAIDDLIRTQVIEGWVGLEMNSIGGIEMLLPLQLAERQMVDSWNIVYRLQWQEHFDPAN